MKVASALEGLNGTRDIQYTTEKISLLLFIRTLSTNGLTLMLLAKFAKTKWRKKTEK